MIIAVLIANAIAQSLNPSIYDSIIQIKKLPFLPSIAGTSSAAHNILVEDIMIRDVIYVWRECTYRLVYAFCAAFDITTCRWVQPQPELCAAAGHLLAYSPHLLAMHLYCYYRMNPAPASINEMLTSNCLRT